MSIWSTFLWIEPVDECDYGPGKGATGGFVEAASAEPWYGSAGLRLSIAEPSERTITDWTGRIEAECLLRREQVIELRDALTGWLSRGDKTQ